MGKPAPPLALVQNSEYTTASRWMEIASCHSAKYRIAHNHWEITLGLNSKRMHQQVCVQLLRTLTTWHCPHSPAAAATIDWHLLPAGPTAANLQRRVCICYLQLAHAGTDGRTPCRCIDAAPYTMRAVQIITAVPHAYKLVYRVAQQSRCPHTTANTVLHRFSKFLQPKISNNIIKIK